MSAADTIAAIATAPGRGGVGIVRVSGPKAFDIAKAVCQIEPQVRYAHFVAFVDEAGGTIDEGLALFFKGPNSFTGEDVLELQGHGGPVVMQLLLARVLACGVRQAGPGEFTQRAFLNDKLDLAQAEAIADLIDAESKAGARSAVKSLQGVFSKEVHALVERLIQIRLYVEAAIDFPEEEIDFIAQSTLVADTNQLVLDLKQLLEKAEQGHLLQTGMTIVIAGRPNAGKSSLLNALSGRDSAIVTNIAGTTRDVLKESISIEGVPLHIIDTAGIRITEDEIEREGVKRARDAISKSDRLLLVVDAKEAHQLGEIIDELLTESQINVPMTVVINKIDEHPNVTFSDAVIDDGPLELVSISAKTGEGLDSLKDHLLRCVGFDQHQETEFSARSRHLSLLTEALNHLETGLAQLAEHQAGELFADDCRQAQEVLGQITGAFTADDLLGRIFSSFCIGK